GPTIMTESATSISATVTKAKPIANGRVFQNGLSSCTSYAIFKASIAAENPPEDAQRVPRMPKERNVPRLGVITSDKTLRANPMLSGGKNRAIIPNAWLKRSGNGRKATAADRKMRAGNSERTKKKESAAAICKVWFRSRSPYVCTNACLIGASMTIVGCNSKADDYEL